MTNPVGFTWADSEVALPVVLVESSKSESHWAGPFGERYARQFIFTPEELDAHWVKEWGIERSRIVGAFCDKICHAGMDILEVGCNVGNQLAMLQHLYWFSGDRLHGIDINEWAVGEACRRGFSARVASMRSLPFEDKSFDLVFTCGVVSHIEPEHVSGVMREIGRVARKWVFGTEYSSPNYGDGFVWCRDHKRLFLEANPGWRLAKSAETPAGKLRLESYLLEREL